MIDIHTHCLPGIDDGASDLEESLLMLNDAYQKGITEVYATPHLKVYSDEEFITAIEKRNEAYNLVLEEADKRGINIPLLKLGFEVYLDKDITFFENFKDACLEETDLMLCEMPFSHWDSFAIGRLYSLKENGIIPIIAHVERYLPFKENIEKLLNMEGLIYQVNAEGFLSRKESRFIKKLMDKNLLVLAGSDMHGINERKNMLKEAYTKATRKNEYYGRAFNMAPTDLLI